MQLAKGASEEDERLVAVNQLEVLDHADHDVVVLLVVTENRAKGF
jgi:hypothetical protein